MKIFSLLLSLMVFSMVFLPDGSMESHSDQAQSSCCSVASNQPSDNTSNDDDGCCEKGCNPFLNCCGMMGFVPVNRTDFSVEKSIKTRTTTDYYISPESFFFGDIWQPPKV